MAEVLIRSELARAGLANLVTVRSAGTGNWHVGGPMDRRARAELAGRGYDGASHRARQITADWLDQFDLLLAMDNGNLRDLQRMATGRPGPSARIRLFRSFDPDAPAGAPVPDPYSGGPGDFAVVFEMMRAAARGLVAELTDLLAQRAGA
jgi:protein-tyrosine phosphatase